jgi:hypothetical protein
MHKFRYLGVYIVSSRRFRCNISYAKRSFYRAANAIFGKVGRAASEDVFVHLIYSKCVPILIYGIECFQMTKSDKKAMDFPLTRLLMKFFKTINMEIINECMLYFGISLPSELVNNKNAKRARKYAVVKNSVCKYLSS